jgi:hypothetical protein
MNQITTGHGVMVVGSILLAVFSGVLEWEVALLLPGAGVIDVLWPEMPPASHHAGDPDKTASIAVAGTAYRLGLAHGAATQMRTSAPATYTNLCRPC